MKRILSLAVAFIMVMVLSVVAFADVDIAADLKMSDDSTVISGVIPENVDVSNGATVTVYIKGTSAAEKIRVYLSDAGDLGRVTEVDANALVNTVEVVDGAFEGTLELEIDSTGTIQGTTDPTHIFIKGQAYGVSLEGTTVESLKFVGVDAAPAEETPAEETPADSTPADNASEAPKDEAPAKTGIVLAVLPMAVAAAAIAVSKKR